MSDKPELKLPLYEQAYEACENGEPSALEIFITDNEPAGRDDEPRFRNQLAAVIQEAKPNDEAIARAAKAVCVSEVGDHPSRQYIAKIEAILREALR